MRWHTHTEREASVPGDLRRHPARMECLLGSLVAAGIGVALVPASLRELRERDVLYRALREHPRTQLVAISRTSKPSEVLREFLAQLEASVTPWRPARP